VITGRSVARAPYTVPEGSGTVLQAIPEGFAVVPEGATTVPGNFRTEIQ